MVSGPNNNSNMASLMPTAGLEAQVAMVALKDAREARKSARMQRKIAQNDRINLLRKSADKLREMADNVFASSLYQGALGVMSAVASFQAGQTANPADKAGKAAGDAAARAAGDAAASASQAGAGAAASAAAEGAAQAAAETAAKAASDAAAKTATDAPLISPRTWGLFDRTCQAASKFDPFAINNKYIERERAEIDIQAEQASHRATDASDRASDAQKMHDNVLNTLRQIEEAKHRAAMEAAKV